VIASGRTVSNPRTGAALARFPLVRRPIPEPRRVRRATAGGHTPRRLLGSVVSAPRVESSHMSRRLVLAAAVAGLFGCELVVGIHDKASSGGVPCAQQTGTLFCDDFDSAVEAGDQWLWDTPQGASSIELDSAHFVTSPRSAKFVVPSGTPEAQLGKTVGTIAQSFHIELDLRVDVADLTNIPQVSLVQLRGSTVSVNYVLGPGATCQLYEYQTSGARVSRCLRSVAGRTSRSTTTRAPGSRSPRTTRPSSPTRPPRTAHRATRTSSSAPCT
jgi:hypothetical protein